MRIGFLFLFLSMVVAKSYAEEDKSKIIFKKSESHQFGGSKLKGQLKKPELSYIYERKGLRQEQIVNIPDTFDNEIIQGAGQF